MTVAAIIAIIQADKVLKRLREKILSNRGTFRDTFEYSNRAAELLGANFSESVLAMSLDDRVSACVELLRDRYDDIMPLLDAVQKRADLKNKLTIAPKHPPFNAERAEQIGTSLRDLSVSDERIQRRARSAPATATRAIHDDYIEANVELRSSAGIKCYITRVTDGNCCDWCTRVAGRYEYGTEPEGIFHRHDNCGCSVTYENGRERQDVWSKKTWTVPEDAGAPEPVRFTQEQAAAAGAEPPRVFSVGEARELNDVKVKENTAKLEDVYNSSIDNPRQNGIIKAITIDDFELMATGSDIQDDVLDNLYSEIKKAEKDGGFVYSEVFFGQLGGDENGTFALQTEMMANGLFRLNVNTDVFAGFTLDTINSRFESTTSILANNLHEAMVHEKGHAKSMKARRPAELTIQHSILSKVHISGVSEIAFKDGAECIAEVEVLLDRESPVPDEAMKLYNKYVRKRG